MKYFLTTLTLLLALLNSKAQTATYFAQPELVKFAGTWLSTDNDTTIQINLKLVKKYVKQSNFYIDLIEGGYIVKIGGKIIKSSTGSPAIASGGYANKKLNKDKLRFLFHDLEKSKSGNLVFELFDGDTNQAKWTLNNTEGVRVGKYDYSFSVPQKLTMKKVQ